MSNEYIAPAVVLSGAGGIGASVSSRRPLSAPASPFVCPGFCACAADRTSKEARAPTPKNLAHRAIAPCRDTFRLLDILTLPSHRIEGRCCPPKRHSLHCMLFPGLHYIPKAWLNPALAAVNYPDI